MRHYLPLLLLAACGFANPQAQRVQWTSRDTSGNAITVPAPDRATIVAFVRPDQPQSIEMIQQLTDIVAKQPVARVLLVLSGPDNVAAAGKIKAPHPIVLDPEYALSGQMAVHVWPETILVAQDGTEITRLAGLPHTFAADLSTQLDFATNKIDAAARDRRLTTRQVVAATTQQSATRFLIIANALLDRDQFDQARAEIERGLKMDPNEPSLRVALVGVMVKQKQFAPALQMAEQLNGALPSWHVNQLRAEALIGLERWGDAKTAATEAVRLNPRPAHAHYLCGLIFTHDKDFEHAAASFRQAYEANERLKVR
jgi:tetratricopeptide (TPR) repeat protein